MDHTEQYPRAYALSGEASALPMLPGEVGAAATAVADPSLEATHVLPRVEFDVVVEDGAGPDGRPPFHTWTKAQLYARARALRLPGRSSMTKAMLRKALVAHWEARPRR